MQENHSDCPRVAQHALVLGSSGHIQPNPPEPAQSVNTALQSDPSQKSDKKNLHAWLLEAKKRRGGLVLAIAHALSVLLTGWLLRDVCQKVV